MRRRREFLGLVAGASVGLAGCGCGDPFPGYSLDLDLADISADDPPDGDGWQATVEATTDFLNIDDGGIRGLSLGSYTAEHSVQDVVSVGSLRWQDVPDSNREEGECADSGTLTRRSVLATPRPPYAIGPRIVDDETLRSFDPSGEFEGITALRYGGTEPWPPETPSVDDYRPVEVERLPWPSPDDVAASTWSGLQDVGSQVDAHCPGRRRDPRLSIDSDGFRLNWDRPVPEGRTRPVLREIERNGSTVETVIGLQTVDHVPAQNCAYRSYALSGEVGNGTDRSTIERVTVVHVDGDGNVVERRTLTDSS